MTQHLFLTGGTGFIGSRLLKLWLERTDARITLLVRNHHGKAFKEGDGRVTWVNGDLTLPRLGLATEDFAALTTNVTHIVHAGAKISFDMELAEARRVNTTGTAAVLELAKRCRHLERFDFVGTAYVASRCTGIVLEDAHHNGLEHNNAYERSKYEAELLVREAMEEIPATVLRPTIVTCDLTTGYAPATSAFYRLLQAMATGALEVLPGRAETQLDMVPVDYVVEAAFAIGQRHDLAGRCFHLSAGADQSASLGELRDLTCTSFGRGKLQILPPEEFSHWAARVCKAVPAKSAFVHELSLYAPYLSDHPVFDDTNTLSALSRTQVRRVAVADYFQRAADYVRRSLVGG